MPNIEQSAGSCDPSPGGPDVETIVDERMCRFATGERFVRSWLTEHSASRRLDPPIVLGLVHGLGDHSGRFNEFGRWFATRGIPVHCYDQLGHGQSPGRRMVVPSYEYLLRDIDAFIEFLTAEHSGAQFVLFGQSMGGNLVLNHQLREHMKVSRAIAGSPMLRAVNQPGPRLMHVLRAVSYLMPHFRLSGDVDPAGLTRDPLMQRAFESDPLVQRGITLRLGRTLIDSGRWALEHAEKLDTPTLITHGDADPITCHRASLEFAERSQGRAAVRIWPGGTHDLHHDIEREKYLRHVYDWITSASSVAAR